jgi:hypothetical protein
MVSDLIWGLLMLSRAILASLAVAVSASAASAATLLEDGVVYEADYSFDVTTDVTDSNYVNCLSDPDCSVTIDGDPTVVGVRTGTLTWVPFETISLQLFDASGNALSDLTSFDLGDFGFSAGGSFGLATLTGDTVTEGILRFSLTGGGTIDGISIIGSLPTTFTRPFGVFPGGVQTISQLTNIRPFVTDPGPGPDPDPDPGVIPLPAAGWLLLAGVAGLAGLRRRRT